MTITMDRAIEQLGVPVDARALIEAIVDVLAAFPTPALRDLPRHEWTKTEAAMLRRGGLDLDPNDYGAADPFLRTRVKYATLVAEGWTVEDIAARLGPSAQWVRKVLRDRELIGVKHGAAWRLPRFRFDDDGRLRPSVQDVLPRLDPAKSLVAIYTWFTTPDVDLDADGHPCSPREWLAEGRDPSEVVRQAADL
ncbi:MAG: helix-turn-helix domain-containing protein [Chloroflexota bacterium]